MELLILIALCIIFIIGMFFSMETAFKMFLGLCTICVLFITIGGVSFLLLPL